MRGILGIALSALVFGACERTPRDNEFDDQLARFEDFSHGMTIDEACAELDVACTDHGYGCDAHELFCNPASKEDWRCLQLHYACRDGSRKRACELYQQKCLPTAPTAVDSGIAPDGSSQSDDGGVSYDSGVPTLPDAGGAADSAPQAQPEAGTDTQDPQDDAQDAGWPDQGQSGGGPIAATFDCLSTATDIVEVTGLHVDKLEPDAAKGRAWDARSAEFFNYQVKWGMIAVDGGSSEVGMCWAGGYVYMDKPWDASWDDFKDPDGPTRNSCAIDNQATGMAVTGIHFFNVGDGARTNNATSWIVQHSWGEYVRDDCIENDHLHSGRVYDSLFDGCYTGISTRPSSSDSDSDGTGELLELDRVLLRLQAMPYPYKWESKSGVLGADGKPYSGSGVPYGHGNFFKYDNNDIGRNLHFSIRNSVFVGVHDTSDSKFDFPPESLVDACENNTIIWLGSGSFPGKLPTSKFPGCFTIVTGQAGHDLWRAKVTEWHARHPDVDPQRKPALPGEIVWPQKF